MKHLLKNSKRLSIIEGRRETALWNPEKTKSVQISLPLNLYKLLLSSVYLYLNQLRHPSRDESSNAFISETFGKNLHEKAGRFTRGPPALPLHMLLTCST